MRVAPFCLRTIKRISAILRQMTMTSSDMARPASAATAAQPVSNMEKDGEEPQQTKPRETAAIWTKLKRLLGLQRGGNLRENLEDELANDSGTASFSPEERLLLGNILRLRELRIDDVMIPRANIEAVDSCTSLGRVLDLFRESGHSRMPVYHETLDDPRGMVHIKDLMAYIAECGGHCKPDAPGEPEPVAEEDDEQVDPRGHNSREIDLGAVDLSTGLRDTNLVRDLLFVPPSMPATDLMAKMQAGRIQMALVIDEYGGTDGLVSLEDLVEEVVGDIEDEHDEDDEVMMVPGEEGVWAADPRLPLEELDKALGSKIATGELTEDVDTLGGLLYVTAGRVPVRGELLYVAEVPGYEFEILDADPRRIKRLRIRRRRAEARTVDLRRRLKRPEGTQSAEPSDQANSGTDPKPAEITDK
ncbi:CBS domain-containing protein [Roseibium sp. TrichSKD4]|nr:CBS domain-containing protein [Roseibium sp. TrichSKD4]